MCAVVAFKRYLRVASFKIKRRCRKGIVWES